MITKLVYLATGAENRREGNFSRTYVTFKRAENPQYPGYLPEAPATVQVEFENPIIASMLVNENAILRISFD